MTRYLKRFGGSACSRLHANHQAMPEALCPARRRKAHCRHHGVYGALDKEAGTDWPKDAQRRSLPQLCVRRPWKTVVPQSRL